jgi:outer membrane lipoprotein SlyB
MGTQLAPPKSSMAVERGKLMNTSLTVQRMKRFIAVVLLLLTMGFSIEPLGSVASANSLAAAHSAASAQTRRYRRKRSFWQKHRDKLTVAGTALGGAAIGGIAGGKKGAAIGSLVGAGGGALYTYKLRKRRHRRY